MRENTDQKNSEYRQFLRSEKGPMRSPVPKLHPLNVQKISEMLKKLWSISTFGPQN